MHPAQLGPPENRFWTAISESVNGCWIWQRYVNPMTRYATLSIGGVKIYAHRFSYELHYGKIPPGLCVCHKCDNPSCVNPGHLFLGTYKDNNLDMVSKGRHHLASKTHCKNGHPLSGENLTGNRRTGRLCRVCQRQAKRRYKQRLRKAKKE